MTDKEWSDAKLKLCWKLRNLVMLFPEIRMRRLRSSGTMRRLVRETALSVDNLVYPLFVCPGENVKEPIPSMTDCFHFSPDTIADEALEVEALGIPAVLLFGLPSEKDEIGSQAWAENGAVQQAIKQIKKNSPELLVITDVCLCAFTESGHCGVVKDGKIDNDATCELFTTASDAVLNPVRYNASNLLFTDSLAA